MTNDIETQAEYLKAHPNFQFPNNCPFCDVEPYFTCQADLYEQYVDYSCTIRCGECGCEVSDEYTCEAVERWNTRHVVRDRTAIVREYMENMLDEGSAT